MKKSAVLVIIILVSGILKAQTFTNPLLPAGADPWCIYKDGFYYYTTLQGKTLRSGKQKIFPY